MRGHASIIASMSSRGTLIIQAPPTSGIACGVAIAGDKKELLPTANTMNTKMPLGKLMACRKEIARTC